MTALNFSQMKTLVSFTMQDKFLRISIINQLLKEVDFIIFLNSLDSKIVAKKLIPQPEKNNETQKHIRKQMLMV